MRTLGSFTLQIVLIGVLASGQKSDPRALAGSGPVAEKDPNLATAGMKPVDSTLQDFDQKNRAPRLVTAADLLGPQGKPRPLKIPDSMVLGLAFVPGKNTLLLSSGPSRQIEVFNAEAGKSDTIGPGSGPMVSPDGRRVAFSREDDHGTKQIWVSDADGSDQRQLTKDTNDGSALDSRQIAWSPDSRALAYKRYQEAASANTEAAGGSSANPEGGGASTATVFDASQPSLWFPANRGTILSTELHVMSVDGVLDRVVTKLDGPFAEVPDFVWNGRTDSLVVNLKRRKPEGQLENASYEVASISLATGTASTLMRLTKPVRAFGGMLLSPDGREILFYINPIEAHYPEHSQLALFDYNTNNLQILDYIDGYVTSAQWTNANDLIVGQGRFLGRIAYIAVNMRTRAIRPLVLSKFPDKVTCSSDGQKIAWIDKGPFGLSADLYLADEDGSNFRILRTSAIPDPYPEYEKGQISLVSWRSKDNLDLEGLLTLPLGWQRGKKYPMLVNIHGGPNFGIGSAREQFPLVSQSPLEVDYWAGRGYIVFSPDYRASEAYGWSQITKRRDADDAFERDFDDIMSGVDSIIAGGYVDTSRMAVVGHSWGSYEVNWIVSHSNRFKAAISMEGGDIMWDWGSRFGPNDTYQWLMRGSPLTRPSAFAKESAVRYAAQINTPTMFINAEMGVNSPSLPWLYSALVSRGIDSQFVQYAEDNHVIARPENKADLLQRGTRWIDSHLDYHPQN